MEPNYVQAVIDAIKVKLPDLDDELVYLYALLVLTWGAFVSNIEVHDAWAVWRNLTNPGHESLVPYDELSPEVQDLDTAYTIALQDVALKLGL